MTFIRLPCELHNRTFPKRSRKQRSKARSSFIHVFTFCPAPREAQTTLHFLFTPSAPLSLLLGNGFSQRLRHQNVDFRFALESEHLKHRELLVELFCQLNW